MINEQFLQEVERLQMLIKNNVSGLFGGTHRSKRFGSSCEFADYRDYMPGDDVSKIDWNLYARTDEFYLKQYYDERQMHTRIYIDASRSMAHGDMGKAEQALKIAATVAYLSVCGMDKVSVYAIKENEVIEVVSGIVGKEAYLASVNALNSIEFDGDSCISQALLPTKVGYGDGMSVIISDFLTENDYEQAIDRLADKKRHVFCVQILSKEEMNPLTRGKVHFFDSENSSRFYRRNIDREIAKAYKAALNYVIERISGYCASRGADYMLATAEESVSRIFFERLVGMEVLK